jgi:hypothetical protein
MELTDGTWLRKDVYLCFYPSIVSWVAFARCDVSDHRDARCRYFGCIYKMAPFFSKKTTNANEMLN